MKRIAIIFEGVVTNTATWDGESDWNPGESYQTVDITELPEVSKGWAFNGQTFTAPVEE